MKLIEQRDTLREQSKTTEKALAEFIMWLRTADKFAGMGDDWIRVGEVWPRLLDLQRELQTTRQDTLTADEYLFEELGLMIKIKEGQA